MTAREASRVMKLAKPAVKREAEPVTVEGVEVAPEPADVRVTTPVEPLAEESLPLPPPPPPPPPPLPEVDAAEAVSVSVAVADAEPLRPRVAVAVAVASVEDPLPPEVSVSLDPASEVLDPPEPSESVEVPMIVKVCSLSVLSAAAEAVSEGLVSLFESSASAFASAFFEVVLALVSDVEKAAKPVVVALAWPLVVFSASVLT